jgi:hypothetical protein
MDILDGLAVRWAEFRKQWDTTHTIGRTRMEPSFTDFMDWLISAATPLTKKSNPVE